MGSSCVISQPTFLPWLGYFDLIDQADEFVFLDEVQFSKQSWQQRNRIVTGEGLAWVTVPVQTKGKSSQAIKDVAINPNAGFPRKALKTLEQQYRGAPYFSDQFGPLAGVIEDAWRGGLSRMNIALIDHVMAVLGIDTAVHVASELGASGRRSDLLVDICGRLGCTGYLSPRGAVEYLVEDAATFASAGIDVAIHDYDHPVYPQQHTPFVPYASVVDLLFNVGDGALDVIRSGRRDSTALEAAT